MCKGINLYPVTGRESHCLLNLIRFTQVLEEVKAIEREVKAARTSEKQIGASLSSDSEPQQQAPQHSEPVRHEAVAQGS